MQRKANIIAITSGKGGVGKSSIAVNLGILFAKRGKRVCLVDGDYGLANINLLLGLPAKKQPSDLFEKNFNPHKAMIKTEWGLDILPSASGISQQQPLLAPSSLQVRRLIEKLVFDYDIVLIDTAAGIGASVQNYLEVADQALLVVNSEPTSLTDSFGLIRNMRNVQTNYNLLINRVKDEKASAEIYKRFSVAVKNYIGVEVEYLNFIQEDSFASAAVLSQSPLVIYSANCKASQCFSRIVKKLLAQLQRKDQAQIYENCKVSGKSHTSMEDVPDESELIKSSEDSFDTWLLQMPNLLLGKGLPINDHKLLNLKQRKEKFVSELGDLCLNNQSIIESFENMVIGKRIQQDEYQINKRVPPPVLDNENDKIIHLADYAESKLSM